MPSSTSVRLTVRGTDQTRAMLAGIRARLGLFASQVRTIGVASVAGLAGGVIALGAAIQRSAREFSVLGDRAAQAGTTADELTRLTSALDRAGVRGANLETITQGLARMAQTTGRTGVEGLRETLAEISSIGDEGARVRELSRVFGRTFGPGLAALVRQGPDALREGLEGVMAAMPGVNNRLVEAGDALADGFATARDGILRGIQSLLVELGTRIVGGTGMTARQLGAVIAAYARYYTDVIAAHMDELPAFAGSVLAEIGARIAHAIREWTGWLGDLGAFAGMGLDFLAGFASGEGYFEAAESAVAAWGESYEEQIARIRAARAGLLQGTEEQRAALERSLEAARNLDGSLAKLASGSAAGEGLADNLARALGPVRDAQATLASSYQAFRIAQHSGGAATPTDRAALDTAKNTATLARNSDRQTRLLERTVAALSDDRLYTLA